MAADDERMRKLRTMLEKEPNDAFLLYGLALEYKKRQEFDEAMKWLGRVIAVDPGYCYAYYQRGLVQEMQGDVEAAKRSYREGIAAAERKGDAHAREELSAALQQVERS